MYRYSLLNRYELVYVIYTNSVAHHISVWEHVKNRQIRIKSLAPGDNPIKFKHAYLHRVAHVVYASVMYYCVFDLLRCFRYHLSFGFVYYFRPLPERNASTAFVPSCQVISYHSRLIDVTHVIGHSLRDTPSPEMHMCFPPSRNVPVVSL